MSPGGAGAAELLQVVFFLFPFQLLRFFPEFILEALCIYLVFQLFQLLRKEFVQFLADFFCILIYGSVFVRHCIPS